MSEEQLSALLAKLNDDAGLQEKFKGAADLDAALAIAVEAGFDVSKAELKKLKDAEVSSQAMRPCELSDQELEGVAGGLQQSYDCGRPSWGKPCRDKQIH